MWKKKWVLNLILICTLLAAFFLLNREEHPKLNDEEINYLKQNSSQLTDLSILDDDLQNNKSFIVTELHGVKANYEIKYALITYMNQKYGIKDILVEVSFSSGFLLNKYIQSGDESILDTVFSFYKGSTFWSKEEYDFYKSLYEYNLTVNNEQRLTLYGVDIEHSLDSSLFFYQDFTKKDDVLLKDILNRETDDPIIKHLILNIQYHDEFYNQGVHWQFRDEKMYENYLFLKNYYSIERFFGQFGSSHCVEQLGIDDYKSFAYFLNNDEESNVLGRVIVMQTFYKNSKIFEPVIVHDTMYYKNTTLPQNYASSSIDAVAKEGMSLYKLNKENSPYHLKMIWYLKEDVPEGYVTTDYYQYIILVNESKACSPLAKTDSAVDVFLSYIKHLV